jgi:hypothetical protein
VAGYDEEIERLWAVNPGLRSRFSERLWFRDYDTDELLAILENVLAMRGITELDLRPLAEPIAGLHRGRSWANAREMRNFADALLLAQARRVVGSEASPFVLEREDLAVGLQTWVQRRGEMP